MNPFRAAVVALLAVPALAVPGAAAPAPPRVHADFNGDGYADIAVAAAGEAIGRRAAAGAVTVLYGTAAGLGAQRSQQWHQDSNGIAGAAEAHDNFGAELATGDFDDDGYTDLAVSAPGEDVGTVADAGILHVIYGSAAGLAATRSAVWHEESPGVPGDAGYPERFAIALAAADFDADGITDLAVSGVESNGTVWVFRGATTGLRPPARILDVPYGATMATGDFDGSGTPDLAIGAYSDEQVHVVFSAAGAGLNDTTEKTFDLDSPGVEGTRQDMWETHEERLPGGWFGTAVAAADFNGDGYDDLAVGAPEQRTGSLTYGGWVVVLPGSAEGPTGTGSRAFHQDKPYMPGRAASDDLFGAALSAGDLDGDGYGDLAIGAPGDAVGSLRGGTATVLYGASNGLAAYPRVQLWHQNSANVDGSAEAGDGFGASVTVGDAGGDTRPDLVVGAPGEALGSVSGAGLAHVLLSGAGGVSAAGDRLWHQDVAGVAGTAERGDHFGNDSAAGGAGTGIPYRTG